MRRQWDRETKHRQVGIRWHGRGNYKYRPDYRHDGRIILVKSLLDKGGMLWEIDGICALSREVTISDLSPNFFTMVCLHMPYTGSTRNSQRRVPIFLKSSAIKRYCGQRWLSLIKTSRWCRDTSRVLNHCWTHLASEPGMTPNVKVKKKWAGQYIPHLTCVVFWFGCALFIK